jgi:hypothetical protein
LRPGTTYNYRVVGESNEGTVKGECRSFTTYEPPATPDTAKPTASTLRAKDVTSTSATLQASVNPNGLDTEVRFSCCARNRNAPDYFPTTPAVTLRGFTMQTAVIGVMNLKPDTVYRFAVRAKNSRGETVGRCVRFRTRR